MKIAALYGGQQFDTNNAGGIGGTVAGGVLLDTGDGKDTLTLSGKVGGRTTVFGGGGDDTVMVTGSARLMGPATLDLGAGNDQFTLADSATISTLRADGGPGTNTFVGTKTRAGLTLRHF